MTAEFIDRTDELRELERHYATGRAELLVVYGRRRVGKTELLRAFCRGKASVFVASLSSEGDLLAGLSQAIWSFNHPDSPDGFSFPSWESAFRAIGDLPGRPVVVLDEFTYLASSNPAVPSILQKVWDEKLQHGDLVLVLCGSYVGIMERTILGHQAPLYGRQTGGFLLTPLALPAAATFFPRYRADQQIEAWGVLGGMPHYLRSFSDTDDLFVNIRERILDERGALRNEPRLLLMEELREPRNYFSVLRAIAQGRTRLTEIVQAAGVGDAAATNRYLDVLQQMRLVRRAVPVTEPHPEKSRKGAYQIADPFLRFWFRFVHPYSQSLELGLADAILEQRIMPFFDQYMGLAFEEAARAHVARLAVAGRLPFLPERVGGWWDGAEEIDVLAVSDAEGAVLVGECKWSRQPVGDRDLADLRRKAAFVSAGRWPHVYLAIFARKGSRRAVPDVQVVRPAEMVAESL